MLFSPLLKMDKINALTMKITAKKEVILVRTEALLEPKRVLLDPPNIPNPPDSLCRSKEKRINKTQITI